MKATDLMIGDWVYGIDGKGGKHPCRINTIDIYPQNRTPRVVTSGGYGYQEEHLEPIPLTPEILEKSGFENISNHTLKGCNTFRIDIEQRGYEYCITIKLKDYFRLQSFDDRWYTLCEMEFGCNYVHELQHALRLCGIDLEIKV